MTKHALCIVLIQLEVFRVPPAIPILLLNQFATCEFHSFVYTIEDIAVIDEGIRRHLLEVVGNGFEIPA